MKKATRIRCASAKSAAELDVWAEANVSGCRWVTTSEINFLPDSPGDHGYVTVITTFVLVLMDADEAYAEQIKLMAALRWLKS